MSISCAQELAGNSLCILYGLLLPVHILRKFYYQFVDDRGVMAVMLFMMDEVMGGRASGLRRMRCGHKSGGVFDDRISSM